MDRKIPSKLLLALILTCFGVVNYTVADDLVRKDEKTDKSQRFETTQFLMGVKVRIVAYSDDQDLARKAIVAAIKRIRELENRLSDYDPDSEIMQLSKNAEVGKAVPASEDLIQVLKIGQQVHQFSEGAFDPAIGRLTKLWRTARRNKQPPEADEITKASELSGWKQVRLDVEKKRITFLRKGVQFDLGGIAKGYAADAAIKTLKEAGVRSCLVDAGGDVTLGDAPPNRKGWNIAVTGNPNSILTLSNASVATSGDRYQFIEIDSKRYSHIIDPRTGFGTTHQHQVTVVSKHCEYPGTLADAYASAFSVMNLKAAKPKINKVESLHVLIQKKSKESDNFETKLQSKQFPDLLSKALQKNEQR